MSKAINYINETLGTNALENPISNKFLGNLPMYITQAYKLYDAILFDKNIVLVEQINQDDFSILQTEKHLQLIRNGIGKTVVLVLENLQSYNRKRLIEKGINFIVPDKQLFLPELLINLNESYPQAKTKLKSKSLMPSSQFLLLFHIIHKNNNWKIEGHSFKEIAKKLDYTPMAVSYAVDDLKNHELIEVTGEKEKYIKFNIQRSELWHIVEQENLLSNPVLKTVFVDELPYSVFMLKANASALPEYTSINPSKQHYYAIDKNKFYELQKSNALLNANDREGKFAIEVWKYNPVTLLDEFPVNNAVVDPLSLYLSLKDNHDERIEMALEQIIEKYTW
ncbi:MarR family transcriptional regulator [Flavobacterium caseinilyticum]|uniref:MarR family transcriptional regulator n=1 Tax=Flavobacterium caseinilyticum TaxID=2541732 RepID=A0A4R5ANL2_9FLAO|nr:helix-turn-helix domain-containing protein [Flavobacterium caseinilyticum]TDD73655.1 MarR family transcriptional regulator [Flavobacterium caseinilyticum]